MIVVDASVAYKWLDKEDPNKDIADQILREHISGRKQIIAPDFILYELGNAWATKSKLKTLRIKISLKVLQSYNLGLESASFDLVQKAIVFSRKYDVSVYDASYAVLAKEKKCNLITADEKFVRKINLPYVRGLRESS